jgi:alkylation response protein AidB-like acyl-CoA dehydrogenase
MKPKILVVDDEPDAVELIEFNLKANGCDVISAADRAIQTHGGSGFDEDVGVIAYWERTRLMRTAPISKEMILNFVGEHVLGLPRSY